MLEKKELFRIMREQNYWYREIPPENYTKRPEYIQGIKNTLDSRSITVIKGPRRAGKTVLIDQTLRLLLEMGIEKEQMLYVNLEDYRFYKYYSLELLEQILETYEENINYEMKAYVFIDEIQNIEGFERFLRTKLDQKKNIKFIITGSNAKLLSKELGTLLTGRMTGIEVFPFSFKEYMDFNKVDLPKVDYYTLESEKLKIKQIFHRYMEYGAIPEFFEEEEPRQRQIEYFENVLFRDIVERYNIRNVKLIKELGIYLASNTANLYSINQLSKTFDASVNTIQSYLSDLNMAYLFFYMDKFSFSFKGQVNSRSKSYCIDTGLLNAVGFKFSEDRGRILENIVFLELTRYGNKNEIYYHRDAATSKECDFIVKEGLKISLAIQVTESLDNEKTRKREFDGLVDAMRTHKLKEGLILTDDEFDNIKYQKLKIKVRPIWFWLLNKEE